MAIRFTRTQSDGASEILTLVNLEGFGLCVEVCAGSKVGDDFVGLYDLDGDQIPIGNASWDPVEAASPETIAAIETDWETGLSTVARLE